MKKNILFSLMFLSLLKITNADYIARFPLEDAVGGSLPSGSLIFSNEITSSQPNSPLNDWLGCRYGYIGDTYEYYIKTTTRNESYIPTGIIYDVLGYQPKNLNSISSWSQYSIRRVILNNAGNSSGAFQNLSVDINTSALTNSWDFIEHEGGGDRYYHKGNLMFDNGVEKYYELCIVHKSEIPYP